MRRVQTVHTRVYQFDKERQNCNEERSNVSMYIARRSQQTQHLHRSTMPFTGNYLTMKFE